MKPVRSAMGLAELVSTSATPLVRPPIFFPINLNLNVNFSAPFILPGEPGNFVTEYPEGYNATISGPSGNITVNGTLTYGATDSTSNGLSARGIGAGNQTGVELNTPPYAIHNGLCFVPCLVNGD